MPDDRTNNPADQVLNDPSSFLFASLADFYRENMLFPEAIAMCQSGLEAQPDNVDGRMVLARCYLATAEPAKAREELVKILARHAGHAAAQQLLGEIDRAAPAAERPAAPAPQRPEPPRPAAPSPAPAPLPPAPQPPAPPSPDPAAEKVIGLFPTSPATADVPAVVATAGTPAVMDTVLPSPPPAPAARPEPTAERKPAAPASQPEALAAGYGRLLAELQQTPQVLACLLVDDSGYVVAEAYANAVAGTTDSESTAALAANVFGTAAEAMGRIRLGALERVVVETATEKVFLRKAGPLLLLLSAEKSVKMGLVAVNSKRAAERIAALAGAA